MNKSIKEYLGVTFEQATAELSPRQKELLGLIGTGIPINEIVLKMNVSPNTVRVMLHSIRNRPYTVLTIALTEGDK